MKSRRSWLRGIAVLAVITALATAFGFWLRPLSFYWGVQRVRMAMAGAHGHFVQAQGIRIHYYVAGPESGTPVVLVHGFGARSEDWVRLLPFLTRAGYRVYLPDLPGYGQSDRPGDFSYSVTDEGNAVFAWMDQLGLQRVHLGGWSMGGWIVQRMAFAHPERIDRLLVFDSVGLNEQPKWNTSLFIPRTRAEIDELDALLMPKPAHVPGFVARDILRHSGDRAWMMHRALRSMLTGGEVTDALLPQLRMPVLFVWGGVDRIAPLSLGVKMHQLVPRSQLFVAPGCGHLAPNQCADVIGPAVVQFLQ